MAWSHPSPSPHIQLFPVLEPRRASKSQQSAQSEHSLPVYTLFVPQGLAVSIIREEVSQLLTEMGMGGRRREMGGQRAQGLQRSLRKEQPWKR